MEKLKVLVVVFVVIYSLTSCSTTKVGGLQIDRDVISRKFYVSPALLGRDSFTVTPERIGVTEIKRSFATCPDKSMGECATVEFVIGLEIDKTLYQLRCCEVLSSANYGEAMGGRLLSDAELTHTKFKKVDPQELVVTMVKNNVIKVSSKERWQGNGRFIPPYIVWENK